MSGGIKVSNRDNPIVFFDIAVGGKEIGRLKMEVKYEKIKISGKIFVFSYFGTFVLKPLRIFVNFALANIKKTAFLLATKDVPFIVL